MTQYLKEFDLTIEDMKATECEQVFRFGPSRQYDSQTMEELRLVVTKLDGREDVLTVQIYLVDKDVLFLCGKWTLELWNFKIDGKRKVLKTNVEGRRRSS